MAIGGIGSTSYYTGQMYAMGNRSGPGGISGATAPKGGMGKGPDPAEMFSKVDKDGSGGLDQTEFGTLADKISEATGEDLDTEALIAAYDQDGDGELSESETQSVMEDHRPEGPPPPPPGGMMGGMKGMGGDISQFFSDADEDENGSIDETEAQTLADIISRSTGEEMQVETLLAEYDEDEDGVLNQSEVETAMEANRPEGPPPPPPGNDAGGTNSAFGIGSYMKIASMGNNDYFTSQDMYQGVDTRA